MAQTDTTRTAEAGCSTTWSIRSRTSRQAAHLVQGRPGGGGASRGLTQEDGEHLYGPWRRGVQRPGPRGRDGTSTAVRSGRPSSMMEQAFLFIIAAGKGHLPWRYSTSASPTWASSPYEMGDAGPPHG